MRRKKRKTLAGPVLSIFALVAIAASNSGAGGTPATSVGMLQHPCVREGFSVSAKQQPSPTKSPAVTEVARRGGRGPGDDDVILTPDPSAPLPVPAAPPQEVSPPVEGLPRQEGPIDPREDGLEVTMGEWAITLEAAEIRPGTVTFVIQNKGTRAHGFRIRTASGRGRDRFEARSGLLAPGAKTTLTVNLPAGIYRADCYVEEPGVGDHAALGMRTVLTVRSDAPLIPRRPVSSGPSVSIAQFSYSPQVLRVRAGTAVTWTNNDPAPHTVTADDSSFDSGTLQPQATYTMVFKTPGSYLYKCTLHPQMKGRVEVSP